VTRTNLEDFYKRGTLLKRIVRQLPAKRKCVSTSAELHTGTVTKFSDLVLKTVTDENNNFGKFVVVLFAVDEGWRLAIRRFAGQLVCRETCHITDLSTDQHSHVTLFARPGKEILFVNCFIKYLILIRPFIKDVN